MSVIKFNHSIKVPRLYKAACKVVTGIDNGGSLKTLVDNARHPNKKGLAALVIKTMQHKDIVRKLFDATALLKNEPIEEALAAVLTTDLLWGNKVLKGDSKPVQTILKYQNIFLQTINDEDFKESLTDQLKTIWRPRYARVNTLITSPDEVIEEFKKSSWNLLRTPTDYSSYIEFIRSKLFQKNFIQDLHLKELLAFPFGTILLRHPLYNSGALFLQDKASCMATYVLAPEPGSTVLDMCAAPGMKTTHLAAYMEDYGTVYAVEKNEERYELMKDMITKSNAKCIQPILSDALKITEAKLSPIDYILLDAPCSGSGMLKFKEYDDRRQCGSDARVLNQLVKYQIILLSHALTKFPRVRRVVYSTCSVFSEENEYVIREVLKKIKHFKLVDSGKIFNGWQNYVSLDSKSNETLAVRSVPNLDCSDGFFMAALEKVC